MKEHVLYVCDFCGTQYSLKTYALACEKNHKAAASIKSAHYLGKKIDSTGYPDEITVVFADGSEKLYKRKEDVQW